MSEEQIKEVEQEIEKISEQKTSEDDFQIEITDSAEEKSAEPEVEQDVNYGAKVQKRIKKLVSERKAAEQQTAALQEQNAQFQARLERLERGNQHQAENNFQKRYDDTKAALISQSSGQICVLRYGLTNFKNHKPNKLLPLLKPNNPTSLLHHRKQ